MTTHIPHRRWIAGLLVAAMAVATVAPAADAGTRHKSGKGRRGHATQRVTVVRHSYRPARVIEYRSSSCDAPALAGFLGGLVLGAVISNGSQPAYAEPCPVRDDYYYYDPYCHERFSSLEIYGGHFRHHHHPRVVRVIDAGSGRCSDNLRYFDHGGWRHWDGDGDWRGDDGRAPAYDDRDYDD